MVSPALQRRLARLEAAQEIQRIMALSCHLAAAGRGEDLLGLFALAWPGVRVELSGRAVFTGPAQVREAVTVLLSGPRTGAMAENALMTPLIEVSPDAARAAGRWHLLGAGAGPDRSGRTTASWRWATLTVDFVADGGDWKILSLRCVRRFHTPFARSWVHTAVRAPAAGTGEYAPDRTAVLDPPLPAPAPPYQAPPEPGEEGLAGRVRRLEDALEVANLMARHEYLHAANLNAVEFHQHFAHAADVAFEPESWGVWEGREAIRASYVDAAPPPVPGLVTEHAATTPVVEVAGDGRTAKGVWLSPGHETFPQPDGPPLAHWSWGRYGVDFIRENGAWKFWHFHIYTTFRTPYGVDWVRAATEPAYRLFDEGEMPPGMPPPTRPGTFNQGYHPDRAPVLQPAPPSPYATFDDAESYIPNSL